MGESVALINQAISLISQLNQVSVIKTARFYQTAAWGETQQADFINTAILVKTTLSASELLAEILNIENLMGRQRNKKWGPRLIDIDILLFGTHVVNQPQLTIPHPYITERNFVLLPLYDLNTTLLLPGKGKIGNYIHSKNINEGIITVL